MTEADWLACADPHALLLFLAGRAGDRKLRLFAAACLRRVWPLLDELGRAAVEVAERFADGAATAAELRTIRQACKDAGGQAAWYAAASSAARGAANAARSAQSAMPNDAALAAERAAQADLLRDVCGNPFRPLTIDPTWLTPHVRAAAQAIDAGRRYAELHLLADALESAGCRDPAVLGHCRGPGAHVRGCFLLDALLGRE